MRVQLRWCNEQPCCPGKAAVEDWPPSKALAGSEESEVVMPRSNATKLVLGLWTLVCTASVGAAGTPDLKKLYKERVEAARQRFDAVEKFEVFGWNRQQRFAYIVKPDPTRYWGRRLLEAELALCENKPAKAKAYEAYWKRAKHYADIAEEKKKSLSGHQKLAATYVRLEAEMWFRQQEADPDAVKSVAKARLEAARKALGNVEALVKAGRFSSDDERFLLWPRRLLDAQLAVSTDKKGRVTALESYLKFQKTREKIGEDRVTAGIIARVVVWQIQFDRLDAELMLKKEVEPKAIAPLARKKLEVAREVLKFLQDNVEAGRISPFESAPWARHVLEAQLALEPAKHQRIEALQDYLNQTKKIEKMISNGVDVGKYHSFQLSEARYYRVDAEILLLQAKGK
jgi:hypothetical protein